MTKAKINEYFERNKLRLGIPKFTDVINEMTMIGNLRDIYNREYKYRPHPKGESKIDTYMNMASEYLSFRIHSDLCMGRYMFETDNEFAYDADSEWVNAMNWIYTCDASDKKDFICSHMITDVVSYSEGEWL